MKLERETSAVIRLSEEEARELYREVDDLLVSSKINTPISHHHLLVEDLWERLGERQAPGSVSDAIDVVQNELVALRWNEVARPSDQGDQVGG